MARGREIGDGELMVTAAQQTVAVPTTAIVLLIGATIFALGFAWAVMKRANADHKAVKAAVKTTRKTFWSTWWTAMKRLTLVAVVGVVLVVWSAREIRHNEHDVDQTVPASVPSVGVSVIPARHRR